VPTPPDPGQPDPDAPQIRSPADPARDDLSPIPGIEGWSYGPITHRPEEDQLRIPLVRHDGKSAVIQLPGLINDGEVIRQVAVLVIESLELIEDREGLGA
jgi:hypothetical protein